MSLIRRKGKLDLENENSNTYLLLLFSGLFSIYLSLNRCSFLMKLKLLVDKVSLLRNVHKLKTDEIFRSLSLEEKTIALVSYCSFVPKKWVSWHS